MSVAGTDVRVIEPRSPGVPSRLVEAWRQRRLVRYFGRQMLEKLYKRTWLGWWWVPLRPVFQAATSVFVFGGLLGVSAGPVPYAIFFLLSASAWELFSFSMIWGTRSVEMGRRVLRRMYAPRLTCLVGALYVSGIMFAINLAFAIIALGVFLLTTGELYVEFGLHNLLAPLGLLLLIAIALSICCFTAVFATQARDVRFVVNYALGFWMFITPVIYPLAEVPDGYRAFVVLNPLTFPVELWRYGILGQGVLPLAAILSCASTLLVVGGLGLRFFNRAEARSLDSL